MTAALDESRKLPEAVPDPARRGSAQHSRRQEMRELNGVEMDQVDGGMSDFTTGGIAVIGLGFMGGPLTGAFGLLVGGSMLIVGHYQQ
ncbi:hypothetical protein ABD76_00090 [Paenibacillus dendritiformis]|nr:hypothetical protein [Paenibacillus dendritiformis]